MERNNNKIEKVSEVTAGTKNNENHIIIIRKDNVGK